MYFGAGYFNPDYFGTPYFGPDVAQPDGRPQVGYTLDARYKFRGWAWIDETAPLLAKLRMQAQAAADAIADDHNDLAAERARRAAETARQAANKERSAGHAAAAQVLMETATALSEASRNALNDDTHKDRMLAYITMASATRQAERAELELAHEEETAVFSLLLMGL